MLTVAGLKEALGDGNINMIGVWGMAGVGKSTLVREVAKKVKEEKLFDEVAIAIVKQSPDLKKLQVEIAEKLDLKFDKESLSGRADLLRERLTKDKNKKILVILDDIWEKLDLDEIGVPSKGCKVVVTSRDRDILSTWMGTDKVFELQVLPKEEAWSLFEKFSGDSLKDSNLRSRAIEVSTACAGLEELYVGNSFTQWEVEGLNNERASLAELKHLSQLTTLEVHIPDANMLPKDLALKLKLNTSFQLESGIKMLLNGIEDLCLDELKGVESIIYELDTKGFQQLKHLHVQNNVEIKYIIDLRGLVIDYIVFPALEIFSLKNMNNLEEICHGQLPLTSFRNLRIVKVEHCEKLKFVFSSSIAKGLSQLQELEIRECSIMGAIVLKEEAGVEDRDMILLPQLRHLVLHRLPKLMSFLSTQKSVINDAGEIIPECDLDFHMPILLDQVVFPNLETLELSYIDSEEILQNQHQSRSSFKLTNIQTKSRFQNLRSLKVEGSGSLKYLLSSSTARVMEQLKYLSIKDCKVMEEILLTEDLGEEEEIIPMVLFPRLIDLELIDLPVLKRFCIGIQGITVSKELKEMNSEEISLTTMQPLFNEEPKVWYNSRKLSVSECESITEVVAGEGGEGNEVITFSQLTYLKLDCLPNLTSFCSRSYSFEFPSLEEVIVSKCPEMKIFCHGILSTPKLERVQATKEDEWHWKVDLNTTVRTLALEGQTMIPLCNSSSE
uniref:AAA+ ATPase domain-containing protein n=1 Tax=Fagus sylvatica TaxID=28930 RepID=A0A2N9HDE3_FAGSY